MIPERRTPSHPRAPRPSDAAGAEIEELFHQHREVVRRTIRRVLRSHDVPFEIERFEDLEQDVWCRLLERRRARRPGPRGRLEGETIAWLVRVAESVVIDGRRSASAAKRRPARLLGLDETRTGGDRMADRRSCPERGLVARDALHRYLRLCRRLLGRRDLAIRLRIVRLAWFAGCTSREVVERIGSGWTVSGVDSVLYRLRRRLAGCGAALPRRSAP